MFSCDGQSLSISLSDSKASSFIGNRIKAFPISDCPLLGGDQGTNYKSARRRSAIVLDCRYGLSRLPIHLACSNQAPKEVIEALLDAYPEGCVAREGARSRPLHLECKNRLPLETVHVLLKKSKKAARIKDNIGRLPLHLACECEWGGYVGGESAN